MEITRVHEDCVCKVASIKEDISGLIEAGFEYVCEHEGLQYFRKIK